MPIVNIRNEDQGILLNSEFIRRQDHLASYAMLPGLLHSMYGLRQAWLFSSRQVSGGMNVVSPVRPIVPTNTNLSYTSTAGVCTAINPADPIVLQNGWGNYINLGLNGFALFGGDAATYDVSCAEAYIPAASRGLTGFVAMLVHPNFPAPAGQIYSLHCKWNITGGNQKSWRFEYYNSVGNESWALQTSINGALTNQWLGPLGAANGMMIPSGSANYYALLVGFSYIMGVGTYFYHNDKWSLDAAIAPTTIFDSTAPFTLCRVGTSGGAEAPWLAGGYFSMAGLLDVGIYPAQWRAFYEFVKPTLLYNTDMSGT